MSAGVTTLHSEFYRSTEDKEVFKARQFGEVDYLTREGEKTLQNTWPDEIKLSTRGRAFDQFAMINHCIAKILAAVQRASLVPVDTARAAATDLHANTCNEKFVSRCSTLPTDTLLTAIRNAVDQAVLGRDHPPEKYDPAVVFDDEYRLFDQEKLLSREGHDFFSNHGDSYFLAALQTLHAFAKTARLEANISVQDFLFDVGRPWLEPADAYEPEGSDGPVVHGFSRILKGNRCVTVYVNPPRVVVQDKTGLEKHYRQIFWPESPLDYDRASWEASGTLPQVRAGRIPAHASHYSTLDPRRLVEHISDPRLIPLYVPFIIAKTAPNVLNQAPRTY